MFTENQTSQDQQDATPAPAALRRQRLRRPRTARLPAPRAGRRRLHDADRSAVARHPAGAGGPRSARVVIDRQRQDGLLRAAGAARRARRARQRRAPRQGRRLRPARAGADAHPRTGDPGLQGHRHLWPPCAGPARRHGRRRRALWRATEGHARPAGRADRDARPPDRPRQERQAGARQRGDAGPRRSRPHARHGLHRRHPLHRRVHAQDAPDDDVQRHLRRPTSAAWPTNC